MKKLAITTLVALASCLGSFGQGYFNFSNSGTTAVWDGFSSPGTFVRSSANAFVTVLFSTDTAATPAVGSSGTPTNSAGGVTWSQVVGDSNFHVAQQTGTNLLAPTRSGATVGTFSKGSTFIDGTSPGQVIKVFFVGWNSTGNNTYGSADALGWSNPFILTLGSSSAGQSSLNGAGMTGFGVSPVPEPSTFALAGLGAAAMLIFRRRK